MQRGHHLFMNLTLQHAGGEISVSSSNSCQIFCSEAVTVSSPCYLLLDFIHHALNRYKIIQRYWVSCHTSVKNCRSLWLRCRIMHSFIHHFLSLCKLRCKTVKEKILLSKENKMSCVNAESRKMGMSKELEMLLCVKISIYIFAEVFR